MLVGCVNVDQDQLKLEDYGMVGIIGFDHVKGGGTKITIALPQPVEEAEEGTQLFTVGANLPHEAIVRLSSRSEKTLTFSQMRVVLFSETYAREVGVKTILKSLYRDPSVGTNVRIAVVKGTVEDLLNKEYKSHPEVTVYLHELLKPRIVTAFNPFTSIHDFIFRMTDQISDPSTPYLEPVNDSVEITKVAIFQEEKMVDAIEPQDAKIVEGMKHRKNLPDIVEVIKETNPETGNEEEVTVDIKFVEARYKTTTNGDAEQPTIHANLYLRGIVTNYDGNLDLENSQQRKRLEEKVMEKTEQRMVALIERFQQLGVDPLGLGYDFRFKYRGSDWSKEKWNDIFKRAEITVNSKITIASSGTIK